MPKNDLYYSDRTLTTNAQIYTKFLNGNNLGCDITNYADNKLSEKNKHNKKMKKY